MVPDARWDYNRKYSASHHIEDLNENFRIILNFSYFKFYCIVIYINCSEIIRASMIYIAIFIQINTSHN